jgi:hypothetical protein
LAIELMIEVFILLLLILKGTLPTAPATWTKKANAWTNLFAVRNYSCIKCGTLSVFTIW